LPRHSPVGESWKQEEHLRAPVFLKVESQQVVFEHGARTLMFSSGFFWCDRAVSLGTLLGDFGKFDPIAFASLNFFEAPNAILIPLPGFADTLDLASDPPVLLLPWETKITNWPNRPSTMGSFVCHARTSHRTETSDAATEGAIRLFGLQTLAAPQVFYCESPSQIERAGGLELPFDKRGAASQHGGPVSPFELMTAQLRHDVLRRDHACARSAWGCGLVLEADGGDTRPTRNRTCG
jgi:hypothetical protein